MISLTKFLFNKYGFTAIINNENFPKDLSNDKYLALTASVKNNSGMFITKNIVELKDCNNNIVFTSQEGKSKSKDIKKAYHEAIREAFKSIENLNYTYNSKAIVKTNVISTELVEIPTGSSDLKNANTKEIDINSKTNVLFAKQITNGFELVNSEQNGVSTFDVTIVSSPKNLYI